MIMKADFVDKALQAEIDLLVKLNRITREDGIVKLSDSYYFAIRYHQLGHEMMVFFHESGPQKTPGFGSIAGNYCGGFNIYKDCMKYYSLLGYCAKEKMLEDLADNHPELFE